MMKGGHEDQHQDEAAEALEAQFGMPDVTSRVSHLLYGP